MNVEIEECLIKKGWFNTWKMRYVACDKSKMYILKHKDDAESKKSYSLLGCQVKPVNSKKFGKEYVFKVRFGSNKLYFAANNLESQQNWIKFLKDNGKRASYLAISSKLPESKLSNRVGRLSMAPMEIPQSVFSNDNYCQVYEKYISNPEEPDARIQLINSWSDFLFRVKKHFEDNPIPEKKPTDPSCGFSFERVEDMKKCECMMVGAMTIFKMRLSGIYVPFQCIVETNAEKYFVYSILYPKGGKISDLNKMRLKHLHLQVGIDENSLNSIKYIEDSKNRLWITDSCIIGEKIVTENINLFIKNMDLCPFIYDSITLSYELRKMSIPLGFMRELHSIISDQFIQSILHEIMIANVISKYLNCRIRNEGIGSLNSIFITTIQNTITNIGKSQFWIDVIIPMVEKDYGITLIIDNIKADRLMNTIQFINGIQVILDGNEDLERFDPNQLINYIQINHYLLYWLIYDKNPFLSSLEFRNTEAINSLNDQISVIQTLYGSTSPFLFSLIILLSKCYFRIKEPDNGILCLKSLEIFRDSYLFSIVDLFRKLFELPSRPENFHKYIIEESTHIFGRMVNENHWIFNEFLLWISDFYFCKSMRNEIIFYSSQICDSIEDLPKLVLNRTLLHKALIVPDFNQEILEKIDLSSMDDSHKAILLYIKSDLELNQNRIPEARELIAESYEHFIAYPKEYMTYVIIEQYAVILDRMNDYSNAIMFYHTILKFLMNQEPVMTEKQVLIIKNIIKVFLRQNNLTAPENLSPSYLNIGISQLQEALWKFKTENIDFLDKYVNESKDSLDILYKLIIQDPKDLL